MPILARFGKTLDLQGFWAFFVRFLLFFVVLETPEVLILLGLTEVCIEVFLAI